MLYKSRHKAILTQCQIGGKTNIFKKKLKIYLIKEIERKKAEEKEILPVKQILDQLTRNSLLYFLPKDTTLGSSQDRMALMSLRYSDTPSCPSNS